MEIGWKGVSGKSHAAECGPSVVQDHEGWGDIYPTQWFRNHVDVLASKLRALPARQTFDAETCCLTDANRLLIQSWPICLEEAERHLVEWRDEVARRIEVSNNQLGG